MLLQMPVDLSYAVFSVFRKVVGYGRYYILTYEIICLLTLICVANLNNQDAEEIVEEVKPTNLVLVAVVR